MQLKAIKISNVLSYGVLDNFEKSPNTIEFKDDLNILIGANGSGKSNLLEIIFRLFKQTFFRQFFIDDNAKLTKKKPIRLNDDSNVGTVHTLVTNIYSGSTIADLVVEISLTNEDLDNLNFIIDNWDELKGAAEEYCDDQTFFNVENKFDNDQVKNLKSFTFRFGSHGQFNSVSFSLVEKIEEVEKRLVYNYLTYFNQIQNLIQVINSKNKRDFQLLKNPLALISSMRTFSQYHGEISISTNINDQLKQNEAQSLLASTKTYTDSQNVFLFANLKIGKAVRYYRNLMGIEQAIEKTSQEPSFVVLEKLLQKYLLLDIKIGEFEEARDTIKLIISSGGKEVEFDRLSMGQKSIFFLLFSIYAYDLNNGLLILDEPELHLHLAMQKKYFEIIKDISERSKLQIILATHSAVFINEKTIKSTFRFFFDGQKTQIIWPQEIKQPEKELLKILTYTNSSRIFFSDDVLLVEGDSDEYFFSFFYENYAKKRALSEKPIEILYIGGKANFSKWKSFLDLYKITTYYICDFDNVTEFKLLVKAGVSLDQLRKNAEVSIISKVFSERVNRQAMDGQKLHSIISKIVEKEFIFEENDKDDLRSLWFYLLEKQGLKSKIVVEYLEKEKPLDYSKIKAEIEALYEQNIFILQGGDLEAYLNISKDLSNVIAFCEKDFDRWVGLPANTNKVKELETIFDKILR